MDLALLFCTVPKHNCPTSPLPCCFCTHTPLKPSVPEHGYIVIKRPCLQKVCTGLQSHYNGKYHRENYCNFTDFVVYLESFCSDTASYFLNLSIMQDRYCRMVESVIRHVCVAFPGICKRNRTVLKPCSSNFARVRKCILGKHGTEHSH